MSIVQFSFENSSIRTLGDAISPLFVAADLATILGYGSTKDATRILDDDEKQTVSIVTNGGKQAMTAVTESGLYAMILKSRRPEAKRFRKWVTSEVLPAIRKTGHYEAQETLTPAEQRAVQQAVAIRAKKTASNYQTIYRAIKARYQIARYDQLPRTQLADCLDFIKEVELSVPEVPKKTACGCPQCGLVPLPKNYVVFNEIEVNNLLSLIYEFKYRQRSTFASIQAMLNAVNSPLSGLFYDCTHNFALSIIEKTLRKHGACVESLKCYQHYLTASHS